MLVVVSWLLLGLLAGAGFVALARSTARAETLLLALGLVIAALLYVVFGAAGGAQVGWLVRESIGVALYGTLAWLGLRYSPWWLASGWALHPAWDVGLHLIGGGAVFAPAWYAVGCIGFDLLVAAYIGFQTWAQAKRTSGRTRGSSVRESS